MLSGCCPGAAFVAAVEAAVVVRGGRLPVVGAVAMVIGRWWGLCWCSCCVLLAVAGAPWAVAVGLRGADVAVVVVADLGDIVAAEVIIDGTAARLLFLFAPPNFVSFCSTVRVFAECEPPVKRRPEDPEAQTPALLGLEAQDAQLRHCRGALTNHENVRCSGKIRAQSIRVVGLQNALALEAGFSARSMGLVC